MSELVSILIPVHNAAQFLAQTLDSALAQSWPACEIIVVDDGSSDGSAALAEGYRKRGVRLIRQPNAGAAAARNTALRAASGAWIQWLDADDLLAPEKIALQMQIAQEESNPLRLYSSAWGTFYYRPHAARFVATPLWQNLQAADWLCYKLAGNVYMQTSTWLMSRHLADKIGPWNEALRIDDDGEYFCRALVASHGVRFVPEAKVYYRKLGGDSLSRMGRNDGKAHALWISMQEHMRHLRSLEVSERVQQACAAYLVLSLLIFDPHYPEIVREVQQYAAELGVRLEAPARNLRFRVLASLFGHEAAEGVQQRFWQLRKLCARSLDRILERIGC